MRALLLDSSWRPINFVKETRAIVMAISGKVEVITEWDYEIKTPSCSFQSPAIVRLVNYTHKNHGPPRFRRTIMYSRDDWTCQYCGIKLNWSGLTIDHVVPKSRGGKTSWNNCVTCCKSCNRKKGCMSLKESGLSLRRNPSIPNPDHFWDARNKDGKWHPMWTSFLGDKNGPDA